MRIAGLVGIFGLWLLQILMAVAFVVIGVAKFADPSWARKFAQWGYPDGFYMVIGALEQSQRSRKHSCREAHVLADRRASGVSPSIRTVSPRSPAVSGTSVCRSTPR